jgi:hypothetical protein
MASGVCSAIRSTFSARTSLALTDRRCSNSPAGEGGVVEQAQQAQKVVGVCLHGGGGEEDELPGGIGKPTQQAAAQRLGVFEVVRLVHDHQSHPGAPSSVCSGTARAESVLSPTISRPVAHPFFPGARHLPLPVRAAGADVEALVERVRHLGGPLVRR